MEAAAGLVGVVVNLEGTSSSDAGTKETSPSKRTSVRRGAQSTEAGNANASVWKRGVQGGDTCTQELHRRLRKVRKVVNLSKEYADDGDTVSDTICDGVVRDDGKPSNDSGEGVHEKRTCLLYTSPSPRDQRGSRMPSSA